MLYSLPGGSYPILAVDGWGPLGRVNRIIVPFIVPAVYHLGLGVKIPCGNILMDGQRTVKKTLYLNRQEDPQVDESRFTTQEYQVLAGINPDEVTGFLQDLVRQRSDYPPGDCRGVVGVVAAKMDEVGVSYETFSRRDHQPNLVAQIGDPAQGFHLMYHAHIDTVPAGDLNRWSVDPFGGQLIEGRVYGRGSGDDKGSVAAQVMALVALARAGVSLKGRLRVVAVSDEETGGTQGTQWLHEKGILNPQVLVVGEQTDNQIAIAERVGCGINLTVYGESAHGAMPWRGENAILKMVGALGWLKNHLFPALAARKHPYLPPPTVNIGVIQGGIQRNIVPESCKARLDRRLMPGETLDQAMAEIRECLEAYSSQVESLRFKLTADDGEVALNINTSPEDPFVLVGHQVLEDVTGESRPLTGYVQTSDGRWFAADGIPILIFGPSDPAVGHSADEHVSVEQLVEATRFLTLLALRSLK